MHSTGGALAVTPDLCRQVPLSGNPIAGIYRERIQFSHNHLHLWKETRGKRNPQK